MFSYIFLGQQDDARMNLAVALTATRHGATVANHVSVQKLYKTDNKLSGARLKVYKFDPPLENFNNIF